MNYLRVFIILLATMLAPAFPATVLADASLGIRAGTLGGGVEAAFGLGQNAALRLSADGYNRNGTGKESDIDYDYKLKLRTAALTGDWFPFANNFRLSLAGFFNGNKIALHGKPTAGTYTINGVPYTAAEVGALDADVDFNKAAPYIGLGYGRPINRGLSLTFDAGVLYQGSPKSKITATCGAAIVGTPTCTQLQNDATAEEAKLNDALKRYKYYPVLTLGLAYTF
jgi:hypothetical protein